MQDCHERLRVLSQEAGNEVKQLGWRNSLVDKLKESEYFKPIHPVLDDLLRPDAFIGRSIELVSSSIGCRLYTAKEHYVCICSSQGVQ